MKRPPGRPPLVAGDIPARVHVTVSSHEYDRAHSIAQEKGISIPELVRRGLARELAEHGNK